MSREALYCEYASLDWSGEGGPRAADYGDVYFSADDGLEETRAVFLRGCKLPQAWTQTNARNFVVGELGFGTGLNALALWELWQREGPKDRWLHFISVEKHPLAREDAARAFTAWPQLKPLSDQLLAQWPGPFKGAHRLVFAADRFTITIFQDEAEAALSQVEARVDAWFLDGFAPAKNEAMWSQAVFDRMGQLSAPGACVGTFTVAGAVRRGLAQAGFEVSKQPGFGRKRERLEAFYAGPGASVDASPYQRSEPIDGRIAIVGSGVAGASLAHALRQRGREIVIVDGKGIAAGASGAPAGLLTPRLEKADRPHVRATLCAFDYAHRLYRGRDGFYPEGGLRLAKDETDKVRLAEIAALMGPGYEWDAEGFDMHDAARLDPTRLVTDLLRDQAVISARVESVEETPTGVCLRDQGGAVIAEAAAVVFANGFEARSVCDAIAPSAGQVAVLEGEAPKRPIVWSGYVCAVEGGGVLLGANHRHSENAGPPEQLLAEFKESAAQYVPAISAKLSETVLRHWSGVRASTPDFLPVVGAVPNDGFDARWGDQARGGLAPVEPEPLNARVYVLAGFGSRGFAHAPLFAESLAAEINGEPGVLERAGRESLHPARFDLRRLKKLS
jgi:tRNA 5-methylaminomethyl-2-thiouridine biosynthesis bifunctional protein